MMTILMPCAGAGKRFREAGYKVPKPLIDMDGQPMLRRVIDNLNSSSVEIRWVFVTNEDDKLGPAFSHLSHPCECPLLNPTNGAAQTCLMAKYLINTADSLLIANCDQLVEGIKSNGMVRSISNILPRPSDDASVLTFRGDGSNKWSYVKVYRKFVEKVAEKQPISDRATCGYYWFRRGSDFVAAAERMIAANDRVNGEFYVAPVLNYLIREGMKVREVRVEDYGATFHGLGTPEDLMAYRGRAK